MKSKLQENLAVLKKFARNWSFIAYIYISSLLSGNENPLC